MCKIMQNIANHVLFTKEAHMRPFNDFLKTNFEAGRRYDLALQKCNKRANRVERRQNPRLRTGGMINIEQVLNSACQNGSQSNAFCRFFTEIASDCETLDTSNHSLSFISDGNVLALHRLLWINQEKIGDYLSSSR